MQLAFGSDMQLSPDMEVQLALDTDHVQLWRGTLRTSADWIMKRDTHRTLACSFSLGPVERVAFHVRAVSLAVVHVRSCNTRERRGGEIRKTVYNEYTGQRTYGTGGLWGARSDEISLPIYQRRSHLYARSFSTT